MTMENELLRFAMNNGAGVVFGFLMFYMANSSIKKNTMAIEALTDWIKRRK